MSNATPTCPYCGCGMTSDSCRQYAHVVRYYYHCDRCDVESPSAATKGDALRKALRRAGTVVHEEKEV